MGLKANFELMAIYNQWMNENIYSLVSRLDESEISKDRGAFFGSIIGTLNHILVGDTIWLKRFADRQYQFTSLNYVSSIDRPEALDTILYSDIDNLAKARKKMDETILQFTNELTEKCLSTSISYIDTKGVPFTKNFSHLLQHFFNHQTHHRGQVSTLLSQAGLDIGVTDLLAKIPDV